MSKFDIDPHMKRSGILVVDDQPANVKLLVRILKANGFDNVISTQEPRDVEKLLAEHEIDALLLDIRMPHMDGFQVLEQTRKNPLTEHLPVLILTAQTDSETRIKALDLGANDFLTKPFDQLEVMLRLRNILTIRLLQQDTLNFNEILTLRVKEKTAELQDLILEVIQRLGRAAEYRDNETGLHVIRMSKYSSLIALELGFSEEAALELENAAGMHDIGKIGTPDRVLLKPGKLDKDEWDIMREHPNTGADILANSRYKVIQLAEKIARMHHEKWDGKGYPAGLAGDDIPLECLIIPVADVFDALTTARPYKQAWPVEDAVEEIKNSSGSHFSPQVVEAFLRALPKILEIKAEYAEPDA